MKKVWVGVLIIIVILIAIAFACGLSLRHQNKKLQDNISDVSGELVSYFRSQVVALSLEDEGQPIEGFDAHLLMDAFPEMHAEDFADVDTSGGHYAVEGRELTFIPTSKRVRSSAEQAVTGYNELLENIASRLGVTIDDKNDIDRLLTRLNTAEHLRLKIGEAGEAFGVTIVPQKVAEDSRCPSSVQCIQAGTVKVSALVKTASSTVTKFFALHQHEVIGGKAVTLLFVSPQSQTGEVIPEESYRFVFWVQKANGEI